MTPRMESWNETRNEMEIIGKGDADRVGEILAEFVRLFKRGDLLSGQKRVVLKEYPAEAGEHLKAAGFMAEMRDFVLYR